MNPQVVLAYYNSPPGLVGVEIHSIRIHRDGPILELVADLPRFPDKVPPKWPTGASVAQIAIQFIDVQEVELSGYGVRNAGDVVIEKEGDMIRFRVASPTMRLSGLARCFDIQRISAYVQGEA